MDNPYQPPTSDDSEGPPPSERPNWWAWPPWYRVAMAVCFALYITGPSWMPRSVIDAFALEGLLVCLLILCIYGSIRGNRS